MKSIRIVMAGVAIVLASASAASGQGAPPAASQPSAQGMGMRRPNPVLEGLELTDAEKVKIEEINKKYQPDMQALRETMRSGGDRAEGMKKMRELQGKMYPELRAVLTPEQQAVFDKHLETLKAMMEARQHQAPPSL